MPKNEIKINRYYGEEDLNKILIKIVKEKLTCGPTRKEVACSENKYHVLQESEVMKDE